MLSAFAPMVLSCGGSTPTGAAGAAAPVSPSAPLGGKLEGTWEIIRYVPREPIPDEAMPLFADMFENMRFSVHDHQFAVDGKASSFDAEPDPAGGFRLKTGGMFDNSACRLNDKGEWEIDDQGPTWPGMTFLKKAKD